MTNAAGNEKQHRNSHKDTVFRMLFADRNNLLSLYNALNKTGYTDAEKLQITTLSGITYFRMKNDTSFLFDHTLNLYEHQSTPNPNMPLRDLFYVADVLKKMYPNKELHRSTKLSVPMPQFVVFYNGRQKQPDNAVLKLSDLFEKQTDAPQLELTVHVININPHCNDWLLEQCATLGGYTRFVCKVRENISRNFPVEQAVHRAVDECIREGILTEFFMQHKQEVIYMSVLEYDEAGHMEVLREEGYNSAKIDDILELLSDFGVVPQDIQARIREEQSERVLTGWLRLAAKAASLEEFAEKM